MKTFWMIVAWLTIACGLGAYCVGWMALLGRTVIWGIPTEFWFYDAIAAGVFGVFFLMVAGQGKKKEV